MPVPEPNHGHTWQPLTGWSGRYRCTGCGGFGYKALMVTRITGNIGEIRPYLCEKRTKGKRCENIAICKELKLAVNKRSSYSVWRCAEHRTNKENLENR